MLQELIVSIILLMAMGWFSLGIYRWIKGGKRGKECGSCTGCPLKENCMKNKPLPDEPDEVKKQPDKRRSNEDKEETVESTPDH